MTDKQVVLEAIQRLPDEMSLQDISKKVELLAAIREGEAQANAGEVITLEQLEKNLSGWLSKSS